VAQPGTLTGSIGVFMGKVAIGGTLDEARVTTETVKSGWKADVLLAGERVYAGAVREARRVHVRCFPTRRLSRRGPPSIDAQDYTCVNAYDVPRRGSEGWSMSWAVWTGR